MMRTACAALLFTAAWLPTMLAAAEASLKITQRALMPVCVGDTAVKPGQRSWSLGATPITMTFTMKNDPRTGIANATPGFATVTFTPEPGHKYEAEVRAGSTTFANRVWAEGQWAPVVRDRTTETVVTAEPKWGSPPCGAGRSRN